MNIRNFNKVKSIFFDNKTLKQTIFKNTFWLAVAEVFTKGVGFLIVIWLARYLGPATYGKFVFALSFVMLFSVLADFGFSTLTVREIARDKSKTAQYIDSIVAMKLILGLITLGLIALIIQFLGKEIEVVKLVYFLGIYAVINTFATFFQSIFRANEKMQYEALCRILQELCLLGLVAFFILNRGSILTISYAYLGAALIGILFSLIFIWRYFSKFFLKINFEICKEILKEALPLSLISIFVLIYYYIDIIMLSIMKTDTVVGWYSVAHKLIFTLMFIPAIFQSAIFPATSKFFITSKRSFKLTSKCFFECMMVIGFPIGVGTTILADRIILAIFGVEYMLSITALQILIWGMVFAFLAIPLENIFYSIDKQIIITLEVGIAAVLNIILNLILIPKYSYIGAGIATTAIWIFEFFFVFIWISRTEYKLSNKTVLTTVSKVMIATLLMSIFLRYFQNFNLGVLIISSGSIYFITLRLLRGVDDKDKFPIRQLLNIEGKKNEDKKI